MKAKAENDLKNFNGKKIVKLEICYTAKLTPTYGALFRIEGQNNYDCWNEHWYMLISDSAWFIQSHMKNQKKQGLSDKVSQEGIVELL